MIRSQLLLDIHDELIVDNFAGGGGASVGIEMGLGRHVDIAVNHDPLAVAMHRENHPQTHHLCEDVFKVDPLKVTNGRPVGLAWFSPDCKHFSKAKGGKPRSKKIRGLAWVAIRWAEMKRPRVIVLENVEEFRHWGPLLDDGNPCPKRKGKTFRRFVGKFRRLGYAVEWRELRACDYGAPTIRRRLYLIARCDGQGIAWPKASHGDPAAAGFRRSGMAPWRTAAECIDWALPCPSIFLTREEGKRLRVKRPLAEATMRRLARGVFKFVIDAKEPFIVQYHSARRAGDDRVASLRKPMPTQTTEPRFGLAVPYIVPLTHQGGVRLESAEEPFRTITGAHRGEKALAVPFLTECANGSAQRIWPGDQPMRTQCAEVKGGHFALCQAFLAKHYGGPRESIGSRVNEPIGTVTSVDHHSLGVAHLARQFGESIGSSLGTPLPTTMPGGGGKTALVRAFLMKYYGEGGQDQDLRDPLHTVPTKDRFGLVQIAGEDWAIWDIGMRMLVPRELYRGQGFPESYAISLEVDVVRRGRARRVKLSQEAQVRMCGNSVSPPMAAALVRANVPEMAIWTNGERKRFAKWDEFQAQALGVAA